MNKKEVIKLIGRGSWAAFESWMYGQTVGINADGSEDYYSHDVEKFVRQNKVK